MPFRFIQHCAEKKSYTKFGNIILKVFIMTLKLTNEQGKYYLSLKHGAFHLMYKLLYTQHCIYVELRVVY
jgi:hypothetical protein